MTATGNTGYGLIKTVNHKSPFYCKKEDTSCVYYIKVIQVNLEDILFFPTKIENNSSIDIKKYVYMLEEVEVGEVVTYEFKVPDNDSDWLFQIEPTQNTPEMFINPDTKPDKL